jgi:aminoglycoside phosphotransferase (APT) family kinase protein
MATLELDPTQIAAMMAPAFPGRQVIAATPLAHGLANANYRVRLSGLAGDLVLRIYVYDPVVAGKERAVTQLVGATVPVAAFLHLDPDGAIGGRPYAILPWIDGVMLHDALAGAGPDDLRQLGGALGTTLAAIAQHRFPATGMLDRDLQVMPWPEPATAFIRRSLIEGEGATRLDPATRDTVWHFVEDNAGLLEAVSAASHLVHADFRKPNLLVARHAGGWRVTAVLDWEFCHSGTPLFDIGILLRGDPGQDPVFEQSFAAAFQEGGGSLPSNWRRVAQFLDLINLCDFLSRKDPPEGLVAYATRLLVSTVRRWNNAW